MKINTDQFSLNDFSIEVNQGPISKSQKIEELAEKAGLDMMPDSFFGDNSITIKTPYYSLTLSTERALDGLNLEKTRKLKGSKGFSDPHYIFEDIIKVPATKLWANKKTEEGIKEHHIDQDWTYLNYYRGNLESTQEPLIADDPEGIDRSRLTVENTIKYFKDLFLYEDDLGDFGYSKVRVRLRIQQDSCFIMMRSYVRVDSERIRSVDNRIFIDFKDGYSIKRELDYYESEWKDILHKGFKFEPGFNIDIQQADKVVPFLEKRYHHSDWVRFK